ncbi:MAG TPA: efflux transporter outer membrane subunit [Humisphaera sp.]
MTRPPTRHLPRRALLLAAGAALLSVTGCLVGPDYKEQQVLVHGQWVSIGAGKGPATTRSTAVAAPAETVRWWRKFNDPLLDDLVGEAMTSNLDLAAATARLRQARAQRGVAAGRLYPSVDAAGSYRRTGTGKDDDRNDNGAITTGSLGTTSGPRHDQYQLGFDASWEIDVFGGQRRAVEAADAQIAANVADVQDVRVSLAAEVAVNYFALRSAQQRLAFARQNLDLQRKSLEVTRRRFAGGLVSGLDIAQAEAQIAGTESAIPAFEQAARAAVFDLGLLLGREPAAVADLLALDAAPIPVTPPEVGVGLPSELLRRRPDVRRAEAQLHAATANIGVATADLFPRFTLTGSFGTESSKTKGLFNWTNSIWSFGPNVSWNLFDAGRIRANIELAAAQRDEQFVVYRRTVLTALHDAERALTAYDYEQRRREGLRSAVAANRRAVTLSQQLYAQGQTEFVNVLTAQAQLLNSEDALVQSDQQVAANLVAIYKAIGGGWEE